MPTDGELPNYLWDFYLDRMQEVSPGTHSEWRQFELGLPHGLRLVKSVTIFDSEILNGGIRQYITNHTCGMPINPYALEQVNEDFAALRLIGATDSAELLAQAIAIFQRFGWPFGPPESYPRTMDDQLAIDAAVDRIDDLRCNEEASRRDYILLERYLREHLDECVIP